ncbi:hypothetical protein D3C87_1599830 [compost metagenome]
MWKTARSALIQSPDSRRILTSWVRVMVWSLSLNTARLPVAWRSFWSILTSWPVRIESLVTWSISRLSPVATVFSLIALSRSGSGLLVSTMPSRTSQSPLIWVRTTLPSMKIFLRALSKKA